MSFFPATKEPNFPVEINGPTTLATLTRAARRH